MKNPIMLIAMIGAALVLGGIAQAQDQPAEMVKMQSLPANVHQTIQQQAAGGQIVNVKREDDANGKWNYEVTVKSNGKTWGFEVDPNGKVVKKHGDMQH
jgi:uncharacterized membrane protein YkoI